MKIYVGITDWNWYEYLRDQNCSEANFWRPSGKGFKAIDEGDLFLFKMKAAHGGRIAGGGIFVKSLTMSVEWAWRAFGIENGVVNLAQLSDTIEQYRIKNKMPVKNPNIGCIILNDLFFLDEEDWFEAPGNWRAIVSGKSFSSDSAEGKWLLERVDLCLKGKGLSSGGAETSEHDALVNGNRYTQTIAKQRLGQGAFRALVADAYHNRCAITGERTMPVLQAAHIRPYSEGGPHAVSNGLFLRSDIHTLYDAGYITVKPDYTVLVSRRIHDDYGNGRIYYAHQGEKLRVKPGDAEKAPSKEYLEWHNDCVYLG